MDLEYRPVGNGSRRKRIAVSAVVYDSDKISFARFIFGGNDYAVVVTGNAYFAFVENKPFCIFTEIPISATVAVPGIKSSTR